MVELHGLEEKVSCKETKDRLTTGEVQALMHRRLQTGKCRLIGGGGGGGGVRLIAKVSFLSRIALSAKLGEGCTSGMPAPVL